MSETNYVYIVTHTEQDYYGDQEKFMGCGATQEAAKQALLDFLGEQNNYKYIWEDLKIQYTEATGNKTTYFTGFKGDKSPKWDRYFHEYSITKVEVR